MDKILMNTIEKQIFRAICSRNVIRKNLIKFINERKVCSVPTLDRTLVKFIKKWGLLGKGKKQGEYPLSEKGREYGKKQETKPTLAFKDSGLAKVIDKLPAAAHQGLIYFILSVIVAKKYLAEKLKEKGVWANFIISGRPKDIKTLLGEIVCRTLDLSFEKHIQRAIGKTEAQVLGEATLIEDDLRKLRLPPYFLYLFLLWDDIDKASTKGAWNALMVYLDGRYKFEERYTPIIKQVTTLSTMNPKKKGGFDIPDYYLRRAFTVNSANLPCDQKENEIIGTDITDNPIPKLKIDGLVVVKEFLNPDEKDFIRDLLYDRWITTEAKGVVDANLLHVVILGMLILQESVDVRYYSYWAVLYYLCFLETLGYTKGNWQKELNQEWGDYIVGSSGDEEFKKEWEKRAIKVKEEKDKIEKIKGEGKVVEIDKDAEERVILAQYAPMLDELKKIKISFEEMDGGEHNTTLLYLSMDIRKFRSKLPTEKKANQVTKDNLRGLEIVLTEWKDQHNPIREAWEDEQKKIQAYEEKKEEDCRYLLGLKRVLTDYFGRSRKDKNGALWSRRTQEVREDIGKVLNSKTQKDFYNKPFLVSINERSRTLLAERKEQGAKDKGGIKIPELELPDWTEEEAGVVEEAVVEHFGEAVKPATITVPYWKYLLIKLDQKLKGKGKNKPERPPFDGRPFEGEGGKGYMGRSEDTL